MEDNGEEVRIGLERGSNACRVEMDKVEDGDNGEEGRIGLERAGEGMKGLK